MLFPEEKTTEDTVTAPFLRLVRIGVCKPQGIHDYHRSDLRPLKSTPVRVREISIGILLKMDEN